MQPPMQPPAGRDQASLQPTTSLCDVTAGGMASQRDLGHRRHHDADEEDYRPSVCSDAEHSEVDIVQPPPRKRLSQQQTCLSRGDSSRGAQRSSPRLRRRRGAAHPPSPLERDIEMDRAPVATFDELPLGDAVLKRVTMDGSPSTFMVQFTWDPCAEHRTGYCRTENPGTTARRHRPARQKSNGTTKYTDKPTSTSRRARYTPADDARILRLKGQGLSWTEIAEQFPGRSAGAIEVRYYTRLKTADVSRSRSRQLCDDSPALSPVTGDDSGEEEWEVEEICGKRTRGDGDLELLVKWKETWDPGNQSSRHPRISLHLHAPRRPAPTEGRAKCNYTDYTSIIHLGVPHMTFWSLPFAKAALNLPSELTA
ncbi:hypothetical protein N658DRAFT_562717 [Parathielavia hyrcaniae]|uniref:Myb-like domain-containing protein n=1 Tax=Parathielavia hyrcaniae TaxID=113614 RepID=A0AAN6SWJ8_9PEZI|nr:hypothetical protein N658DRAFT_562717 [Parathielavia hyrcaniae]